MSFHITQQHLENEMDEFLEDDIIRYQQTEHESTSHDYIAYNAVRTQMEKPTISHNHYQNAIIEKRCSPRETLRNLLSRAKADNIKKSSNLHLRPTATLSKNDPIIIRRGRSDESHQATSSQTLYAPSQRTNQNSLNINSMLDGPRAPRLATNVTPSSNSGRKVKDEFSRRFHV